jgi:hypothetical protein
VKAAKSVLCPTAVGGQQLISRPGDNVPRRGQQRLQRKTMKTIACTLLLFMALSIAACAQTVELSGGYTHITQNEGLDGFDVGGAYYLAHRVSLAFNYDGVYDNSRLGVFELTNVGLTVTNSHLQDWLIGPRFFTPGLLKGKGKVQGHLLIPFIEAQFGESNLFSQLTAINIGTIRSADTTFSWMLGGGGDFRVTNHWAARINLDLLRTHFADAGQSRLRLGLGVAYTFGAWK